jgi:hypothetical protein
MYPFVCLRGLGKWLWQCWWALSNLFWSFCSLWRVKYIWFTAFCFWQSKWLIICSSTVVVIYFLLLLYLAMTT